MAQPFLSAERRKLLAQVSKSSENISSGIKSKARQSQMKENSETF